MKKLLERLRMKLASLILGRDISALYAELETERARLNWILVSEHLIDKGDLAPEDWAAALALARREGLAADRPLQAYEKQALGGG